MYVRTVRYLIQEKEELIMVITGNIQI